VFWETFGGGCTGLLFPKEYYVLKQKLFGLV